MKYTNIDFVTNSSSSNYIMVYKKKIKKTETDYLKKALKIKTESSLMGIINHIENEKEEFFSRYTGYNALNYKTELVKDYGEEIANRIINYLESGIKVYIIKVSDDDGGELLQQYLMYEESNTDNKFILLFRRTYGY